MKKKPTRSLNTLNIQKHSLHTQMSDWPADICRKLQLENTHVDGVYDPVRGWQIVTLHKGKTIYLDCDEHKGVVSIT